MLRRKPTPAGAQRITEQRHRSSARLDTKTLAEILRIINREDRTVARAVAKVIPEITIAGELVVAALQAGGRLVYLGAGTSGRLGALDAAECTPTFGTDRVVAVVCGGPRAMLHAVEGAEDDAQQAKRDLRKIHFSRRDVLMGITASGSTPYTCAGLRYARRLGSGTIALTSNPGSPASRLAAVSIDPLTGPEVVAGSTRMKAGTAQKLVLNMLSTACMVRLGRVYGGMMAGVQAANRKLAKRAEGILVAATGASRPQARQALKASEGNLQVALLMVAKGISKMQAERLPRGETSLATLLREAKRGERGRRGEAASHRSGV